MNVLKWSGEQFSYSKTIKGFQNLCLCHCRWWGTTPKRFDQAIKTTAKGIGGFKVRRIKRPKLKQIDNHLREGGVIVLIYKWRGKSGDGWHYLLLTDISDSGKSFTMVNAGRNFPTSRRTMRSTFRKHYLRFQRVDRHFEAWFIYDQA
jgi:hypothetical protein